MTFDSFEHVKPNSFTVMKGRADNDCGSNYERQLWRLAPNSVLLSSRGMVTHLFCKALAFAHALFEQFGTVSRYCGVELQGDQQTTA